MGMRIPRVFVTIAAALLAVLLAVGSARAGCELQTVAELPVAMHGLRATVTAKINGQDAVFGVDSGAFFSSINRVSVAQYGLKLGPAPFGLNVRGIGGAAAQVDATNVQDFLFGGRLYHRVDFIVLGDNLVSEGAGLIGQNVLGGVDVEYDLADGAIRLFKPNGCGFDAGLAYWAGAQPFSVIDIEPPQGPTLQTVGWATLNGVRIRVGFDTGAPRSLISRQAASRAGVRPGDPGVVVAGEVAGVGERSYLQVWQGVFASFKIGDEEIRNQKLRFGDLGLDNLDMLLGADFFLSHRVLVSNSQHKLYFTYNGGPVFNLGRPGPPAASAQGAPGTPGDAAALERQAAAMLVRGDAATAIADLSQAITLNPNDPDYYFERGRAERVNRQPLLALADFNHALQLKPDDIDALLGRARLSFAAGDRAKGESDLAAAVTAAAAQPDQRLAIAGVYMNQHEYQAALDQYEAWLAARPYGDERANALNGACDARAMLNRELDKALADCDAALKLDPGAPRRLISRGLVLIRMGAFDRALADYQAALKAAPASGLALYGKGVAELRLGRAADGQADIAKAMALQPALAAEMKQMGLTP
jgi:tetratricopeptide (TPR) repeat protein